VLAGGTTLGVVVLSLPLVVPALRTGARLRPTLSFPEGRARRAGSLAGAGVLALVAQQASVANKCRRRKPPTVPSVRQLLNSK
jgi:putative peptidoglycan lipid II flippase